MIRQFFQWLFPSSLEVTPLTAEQLRRVMFDYYRTGGGAL